MKKLYYLPALGSFFVVGLGQIIRGESKKGLQLMITFYLILPAISFISLAINGYLFIYLLGVAIPIAIIIWLYSMGEALLKR